MGLDQYAWSLKERPKKDVDFDLPPLDEIQDEQNLKVVDQWFRADEVFGHLFNTGEDDRMVALAYWRKHPNLHGFIRGIYDRKGGINYHWDEFSGPVVLDREDIDAIEAAVKAGTLPPTTGFFFGESRPEDKDLDLEFCRRAREAIAAGRTVVYDSSW